MYALGSEETVCHVLPKIRKCRSVDVDVKINRLLSFAYPQSHLLENLDLDKINTFL